MDGAKGWPSYCNLDSLKHHLTVHPHLINVPTHRGTPLVRAVVGNDADLVRWLLARGADPNQRNGEFGRTPAHYAIRYCSTDILLILIAAGANLALRSHRENTANYDMYGTPLDELLFYHLDGDVYPVEKAPLLVYGGSPPPSHHKRMFADMFERRRACARVALLIMGIQRFRRVSLTRDAARLLARAVWASRLAWIKNANE